jgi:protein-disulfide isomerase
MSRLAVVLIAVAAALGGGLAATLWLRPAPGLTADGVRAVVVEEMANAEVAQQAAAPAIDAATLHPIIESYLLANPSILEKMSTALTAERQALETEQNRLAVASIRDLIFEDADQVVIGNPEGDVTLVELFDYNCSYCRSALPDMASLLAEDKDLRIVFKEFPILSQDSVEVARIAIAANRAGVDYWAFHSALLTGRGQVTGNVALDEAEKLGLDPVALASDAKSDAVSQVIQKSYDIAQTLGVSGTPTYIIGDEVIPGAVGVGILKAKIANIRACGKTACDG